jgi:uncharacterized protein (TIGR03437 family)
MGSFMKRLVALVFAASLHGQTPTFQQSKVSVGCNPVDELALTTEFGTSSQIVPAPNVVAGDFNGDKKPDLAFLCSGQISVLLGNGDGTFQPPILNQIPDTGTWLLAADLNQDGKTDLVVANLTANENGAITNGDLLILISNGDGKFQAPIVYPNIVQNPNVVALADFTGDGIPDVLFANALYTFITTGSAKVTLFFLMTGKGDGTFGTPVALPTPVYFGELFPLGQTVNDPTSIAVGDLTGNGVLDFMAALPGPTGGGVGLFLGKGGGTFVTPNNYVFTTPDDTLTVLTADVNGDHKPDLLVAPYITAGPGFLYGLPGNGDGTFQSSVTTTVPFGGVFAAGDLNGDGKSDLAEVSESHGLSILISKGDGTFTVSSLQISGTNPSGVVIADLNGDGKLDIVTANGGSGDASILLNSVDSASATAAVNGASFVPAQPVSPGSLATLFGTGFVTADAVASSIPLPVALGNVSVTIGGVPAPLLGVYENQINLQVPWTVPAGSAEVVVTVNGSALSPLKVSVVPIAPGIFTTQSGTGQAVAINPDGSLAGATGSIPGTALHAAKAGEALVILGTGLGPVSPADGDGVGSLDGLRKATTQPTVLIGGVSAEVTFAGLSPQFVGVNQINVVVPKVSTPGVVPLQINSGGVTTSNKVTIAVENP